MNEYTKLSDQQIARAEALRTAKAVGSKTQLGGSVPPDSTDLVDLAEYILHGNHPLDRYKEVEDEQDD